MQSQGSQRQHYRLFQIFALLAILFAAASPSFAQSKSPAQIKKPPVAPPAPQSTHFPILLLAFGNDPAPWSLRIGQKGPERLDRPNYPPIPLDPAEITHEAAADNWTYHAKDSQTGADVSLHLTREPCADSVSNTNYTFRAIVQHAQLGTLNGCARIAAELFPKISNQTDDSDDADKKKPPAATITNFKPPVDVAFLSSAQKIIFKHGSMVRPVASEGSQLAVSHDGKRLLFTREDKTAGRAIVLYDFPTNKSTDLIRGDVRQAFWSPDDSRIAFLKLTDSQWHLYIAPLSAPDTAASAYSAPVTSLHGWTDAHTLLVDDLQHLSWITDDGKISQTVPVKDVYGEAFNSSSTNTIRVSPINPDLLLVSAEWLTPPSGVPTDKKSGTGQGFFLYELRAKRRVVLSPPAMFAQNAEWSRDSLQIFFTGTDANRRTAIFRIFWDGTSLRRYQDGSNFSVGR
jgi:uncharacterized membrane protein